MGLRRFYIPERLVVRRYKVTLVFKRAINGVIYLTNEVYTSQGTNPEEAKARLLGALNKPNIFRTYVTLLKQEDHNEQQ